jgi:hypothetical protein
MSVTARYVLAFLAAALGGALLSAPLFGLLLGALIGACVAVVIVALSDPRVRGILSSTYNRPFSSRVGRRDTRDD